MLHDALRILPLFFISCVTQQPSNPSDVQRTFYELLRRQQQINNALLLNNAFLHNSMTTALQREPQPLPLPLSPPTEVLIPPLPPPNQQLFVPPTFKPFDTAEMQRPKMNVFAKPQENSEKVDVNSNLPPPSRDNAQTAVVAKGVATAVVEAEEVESDVVEKPSTNTTVAEKKLSWDMPSIDVSEYLKKLNLSREDAQTIADKVQQVVQEELARKLSEELEDQVAKAMASTPAPPIAPHTLPPPPSAPTTSAPHREPTMTRDETDGGDAESDVDAESEADETRVLVNRNNLKLHPVSKIPLETWHGDGGGGGNWGAIKTSETHLPIFGDEEPVVEQRGRVGAPLAPLVEKRNEQKTLLQKRIPISDRDEDLLVDFATGAPLDLNEVYGFTTTRRLPIRQQATPTTTLTTATTSPLRTLPPPNRLPHHEMTRFEKLAVDYQRRLQNAGDMNKILQKIYENAYISLVERRG